jgi:nucleoside-diphosphate-sugar epimerase
LIIGGSGFLSGTLARQAVAAGHRVWAVTRGHRALPEGVTGIVADRKDTESLRRAVVAAGSGWDLVVDCIGYDPEDARQDLEIFPELTSQLAFVSTDFVFDPAHRVFPQPEETEHYLTDESYGAKKRLCELELLNGDTGDMAWSVVRPCHIYGPGSQLGCLPLHGRDPDLIAKMRARKPIQLVGGGHFLQQPVLARDLADLILSLRGNEKAFGEIFCTAGPDIIESKDYYRIIADVLGVELEVQEIPVEQHLAEHPEAVSFICHRIYSLDKLRQSGAAVPATPIEVGLREHVESMLP